MDGLVSSDAESSSSSPGRNLCKPEEHDIHNARVKFDDISINNEAGDSSNLDQSLHLVMDKLESVQKELASKMRMILSVKCQLDDVPTQAELIQYEHRFPELYGEIQEKHRQTRKYYATYNALLEIKELMLKETSLLNSINLQFQEAIASAVGRFKLTESLEIILKGTQQKLKKVQLNLQEEQNACHSLKEKYSNAIAEQRTFSLLFKSFQVECAKNERLRDAFYLNPHK